MYEAYTLHADAYVEIQQLQWPKGVTALLMFDTSLV